ncbi:MAG: hypothetical protein EA407_11920 [Rhodobacteraceae bacterium]|nr:MAG: hypothetical protein EA407_11920 [Paracoccaceae bacterium]
MEGGQSGEDDGCDEAVMMWALRGAFCVVALVAALAGVPGHAEDGLTLVFKGESYHFAPEMDGARTGFTRFAALEAVSLEGARPDGPERLVLQVSLAPGEGADVAPLDGRIMFRPDGWRDYWVSAAVFPGDAILIEELELSGPEAWIAGGFDLELCPVASPLHPPDTSGCEQAIGEFRTRLMRD